MKSRCIKSIFTILIGLGLPGSIHAGQFHFPVGFTYVQGINDAVDKLDELYTDAGFTFEKSFVVPVGLSLSPYYEFDNGLGIGMSVGPTAVVAIENRTSFSFSGDADLSYIIPVGADLRYTFLRDKNVSPYLRLGLRYPIVGGPNLDSSQVGPCGAIGLDLWRTKKVGMGVEVGYDASKVKVSGPFGNTKEATFPDLTVSLFVRF